MAGKAFIERLSGIEQLNFLLTNRIPRRWTTLLMGRFSRIEHPIVRELSIAVWKLFCDDLRLHEARKTRFKSLHECFIRELADGARPICIEPGVVVSPCDAVVGAHGLISGTELIQAKGYPYTLEELLGDEGKVERYRDGLFVTLRLKSSMYHRFHAPLDCRLDEVTYVSGDTWNVNPIALRRIERLYCKNERAILDLRLPDDGCAVALVPVAAILVASIRLHCLPETLSLRYRGPNRLPCDGRYRRGEEMGYFYHGSTIIVFANRRYRISDDVAEGRVIRVGEPLLRDRQAPDPRGRSRPGVAPGSRP